MKEGPISDALYWALAGHEAAEERITVRSSESQRNTLLEVSRGSKDAVATARRGWRPSGAGVRRRSRPHVVRSSPAVAGRRARRIIGWALASAATAAAGLTVGFVGLLFVLEAWL